jgi:hypothetical protein
MGVWVAAVTNMTLALHTLTPLYRWDGATAAVDVYARNLATHVRRQLDPASAGEAALDPRAQRAGAGITATMERFPAAAVGDEGSNRRYTSTEAHVRTFMKDTSASAHASSQTYIRGGPVARCAGAYAYSGVWAQRGTRACGRACPCGAAAVGCPHGARHARRRYVHVHAPHPVLSLGSCGWCVGFTHWPLLCVRASPALSEALRSWLQHTFDCRTRPLRLQPHELAHLTAASVAAWMDNGALFVTRMSCHPDACTGQPLTGVWRACACMNVCVHVHLSLSVCVCVG